jgi:eukaryotic-like serine/threonine-protein kinase
MVKFTALVAESTEVTEKNQIIETKGVAMTTPALALIPTIVLLTPLALLGLLFPALLSRSASLLRRWRPVLVVATVQTGIYVAYFAVREQYKDLWWVKPLPVWTALAALAIGGAAWTWFARRAPAKPPMLGEHILLGLLSLSGLFLVLPSAWNGGHVWHPSLVIWVPAWAGSAYLLYLQWCSRRRREPARVSSPIVVLCTLALACCVYGAKAAWPDSRVAWTFVGDDRGQIKSQPVAEGSYVYVTAFLDQGASPHGELYCLDAISGKKRWKFRGGRMKPIASAPCVSGGRVYVTEQFQGATTLYSVDADSGNECWRSQLAGDAASDPRVVDGRVFVAAGERGIYCLDARSGVTLWNFGDLSIYINPAVTGGGVYAGGSRGLVHGALCLDPKTGKPRWRVRVPLPLTASPADSGGQVYFGLGSPAESASGRGSILCLECETGRERWSCQVPDAVVGQPATAKDAVWLAARNGYCCCVDRRDGRIRWDRHLLEGVATAATLGANHLYVLTNSGRLWRLHTQTGEVHMAFDIAAHAEAKPQSLSSPVVAGDSIYIGAGLEDPFTGLAPTVYCLREGPDRQ